MNLHEAGAKARRMLPHALAASTLLPATLVAMLYDADDVSAKGGADVKTQLRGKNLVVTGSQGDDAIILRIDPNDASKLLVEVNGELEAAPGTVNEDPAGKGWFLKIKIKDAGELDALMNEAEYQDYVKSL